MALADDPQLETLFASMLSDLSTADTANTALQTALSSIEPLRADFQTKQQQARTSMLTFWGRLMTGPATTAQQQEAFGRILSPALDDIVRSDRVLDQLSATLQGPGKGGDGGKSKAGLPKGGGFAPTGGGGSGGGV